MKIMLGVLLLLWSLCLQASDTLTVNVDKKSSEFVVTLPANPTTGFQWTVKKYDQALLHLKSQHFVAPQTRLIGAGGHVCFTFERMKGQSYPDTTKMTFDYARSWVSRDRTRQHVVIHFKSR
jgi:inhibitor of cysteine peptidase